MKDVKVSALRQNLPAYLNRVVKGERLRVTSRGKVIAEIGPPAATREQADAARARLRGSVVRFVRPTDPVLDPAEWDMNR